VGKSKLSFENAQPILDRLSDSLDVSDATNTRGSKIQGKGESDCDKSTRFKVSGRKTDRTESHKSKVTVHTQLEAKKECSSGASSDCEEGDLDIDDEDLALIDLNSIRDIDYLVKIQRRIALIADLKQRNL